MQKIIIQKGDSARIAIVLPADKMADVQDVICYVGRLLVFKQSDDTLTATADPNIFHLDLKSDQTNTLSGETELAIAVDFSDFGVKKTPTRSNLVIQVDKNVNDFHNDSVSDLVLATVTVTINETTISATSCAVAYAKGQDGNDGLDGVDGTDGIDGASAYEVAVANGFVGTEAQWLASLKGDDASFYEYIAPTENYITGHLLETEVHKFTVSGGTLSNIDRISLEELSVFHSTAPTGNDIVRIRISKNGVFSTSLPVIATFNSFSFFSVFQRKSFTFRGGNIIGHWNALGSATDVVSGANITRTPFNPANDYTFHISIQLANSANSACFNAIKITK